jgi:hypothetical protein
MANMVFTFHRTLGGEEKKLVKKDTLIRSRSIITAAPRGTMEVCKWNLTGNWDGRE